MGKDLISQERLTQLEDLVKAQTARLRSKPGHTVCHPQGIGEDLVQKFRRQQDDIPNHSPALQQRIGLCRLQDGIPASDHRLDFSTFEQLEQRRPVIQEHTPVDSRDPR